MDDVEINVTVNGRTCKRRVEPRLLLTDFIRHDVGLTGTHVGCENGVCGACTVLLDGAPVASCLLPAHAAAGKSVTTVEGIAASGLHPIQKAFMAHDALQCGFCTPGFIVEATAFHDRWRAANGTALPSREEIGAALSGHLCRCGAYDGIFNAVAAACAGQFDGKDILPPRVEAGAQDDVAVARLLSITPDPASAGHSYAHMTDFLPFDRERFAAA